MEPISKVILLLSVIPLVILLAVVLSVVEYWRLPWRDFLLELWSTLRVSFAGCLFYTFIVVVWGPG